MATLFQMLLRKIFPTKKNSFLFETPIAELNGHHTIMIDWGVYKNKFLKLEFCRKLTFIINDVEYHIYDYFFERESEKNSYLVLRLLPKEDGTYSYLILERIYECGYDEKFYEDLLKNPEYCDEGATYWKIVDSQKESIASVEEVSYQGNSNPTEKDIDKYSLCLWDFWRTTTANNNKNSTKYTEYFYIEMNKEDGWFSFFVGQEIPKTLILFIKD